MKIVNVADFMNLPEGTLYRQYRPSYIFETLCLKGSNVSSRDWYECELMDVDSRGSDQYFNRLEGMLEKGESYPISESFQRDGLFEDDRYFLVCEKEDLIKLKTIIEKSIEACK